MPQSFDICLESAATVAQVGAAFANGDYWLDRLAEFGGDSMTLDSLLIEDTTVVVTTTQDLRRGSLPGPIARVVPGELTVARVETWRVAGLDLHGDVVITTAGAPISGTATAVVSPTPGGSAVRFCGTVHAKLPLIGGRIEKYISGQIIAELPKVQRFTTNWISRG